MSILGCSIRIDVKTGLGTYWSAFRTLGILQWMILYLKTVPTRLLGVLVANWYHATFSGHRTSSLFRGEQCSHRFHSIYYTYCGSPKDSTGNQIHPPKAMQIRIGVSIAIAINSVLFCYLLPPMTELSGVIQTSEHHPQSFKVKRSGVRDSSQLLTPKGVLDFKLHLSGSWFFCKVYVEYCLCCRCQPVEFA